MEPLNIQLAAEGSEDFNSYRIAREQFDRAVCHLHDLKRGLIDFLKSPARTDRSLFSEYRNNGTGSVLHLVAGRGRAKVESGGSAPEQEQTARANL